MKRKLTYLIALLVVLGAAIVPALYMQKVFNSQQQYQQAEVIAPNAGEQIGAADQTASNPDQSLIINEVKQDKPVPDQQVATSNNNSRESAAPPEAASDSSPAVTPESGCMVGIAVVGKEGESLYSAGKVVVRKDNKWGITAMGALDATGLPYSTMPTWPDFVSSICGQANSGVSGWMYSVNGDIPMHMADKHPVKTGDKVIWWYSNSMEQPRPQWGDLVQKK
ncbi:MAG: DUF4430 domain-containing protein [Desulfotomaculaceae bacterium]|nr:DUF4430 domain-containing protein [Desulfotomaculaceae bacterium]